LWYCVKPFTAAALAIAVYFVFRGGFLNMSDDSSNINIYGVITISILCGLFTDRATLKLKEVFDVLLRPNPKEERPDKLTNGGLKIFSVTAAPLEAGNPVTIVLNGEKMNEGGIEISIGNEVISDMERTPESIRFSYTLPADMKGEASVIMFVKPENASSSCAYTLNIKSTVV